MKYVLDANVAAKWALPETGTQNALRIREDYRNQVHELLAPDVFPLEVAHTLVRAERKKLITDVPQHLADIMQLSPDLSDSLSLLPRALEIARQQRRGVYDGLYIALAERENARLITADNQLLSLKGFPIVDLKTF